MYIYNEVFPQKKKKMLKNTNRFRSEIKRRHQLETSWAEGGSRIKSWTNKAHVCEGSKKDVGAIINVKRRRISLIILFKLNYAEYGWLDARIKRLFTLHFDVKYQIKLNLFDKAINI